MAERITPPPRIRRCRIVIAALAFCVVAVLALALLHPKLQWRTKVLALKFAGNYPELTWGDVTATVAPGRLKSEIAAPSLEIYEEAAEGPASMAFYKSRFGDFWGQPDDRAALRIALQYRIYDVLFLRGPVALRRADVVIDAGSHLGTFTRFALDRGARLVVGLEPDPDCVSCFRRTFAREIGEGRVILLEKALWEKTETLKFYPCSTSTDGSVVHRHDHGAAGERVIQIPATTLDEVVAGLRLDRVDFIKLNIEGAERQALAGARRTLTRFRPRMAINLIHGPDDREAIPAVVREAVPSYRVEIPGHGLAYFHAE